MTSVVDVRGRAVLRRAAVRATLAPSVHNTQLAVAGVDARVDRLPDRSSSDIVARISILGRPRAQVRSHASPSAPASMYMLDCFIVSRHTNRHQFSGDDVPAEVLAILSRAVADEQCELFVVKSRTHRAAIAALDDRACSDLDADPAYRAERRAWMQEKRGTSPATHGAECTVIISSFGDGSLDWLHTGEALERLLLEATRQGFVTGPISQNIVTNADRAAVRVELGLAMTPQLVLRIGRAPASPASRRRRLVDVLVEEV